MAKTDLKLDEPIEVTEAQYNLARAKLGGLVFHRKDEETGKFYIKLAMSKYKDDVIEILGL
jgi:hypothetical protein